jgi:AcrR family transcriptional regulator
MVAGGQSQSEAERLRRPPFPSAERRTRPANRRELILAAATELFAARGYEYVGMSEIAEAVAVRPSALYRHFSGKEQLLAEVLHQGAANLRSAVSALDLGGGPDCLLELAGFVIDNRHVAALIGREAPHLSAASRGDLQSTLGAAGQLFTARIAAVRPHLRPHAAGFLAQAALAVLESPAYHRAELPRAEYCAEVARLAWQVISARLPAEFTGKQVPPSQSALLPCSRREALLAQAIALFAERTYAGVGIEDVAASLGIAGPSIYNHFHSKSEILLTALGRGTACLLMQVTDTLSTVGQPAAALSALMASYASFATRHPALIDLMISEVRSLPEPDRETTLDAQRDYVAELVHLLRQVYPEVSPPTARVQIQAALMIANDVARASDIRSQAGSMQAVTALTEQLLALPPERG